MKQLSNNYRLSEIKHMINYYSIRYEQFNSEDTNIGNHFKKHINFWKRQYMIIKNEELNNKMQ